MENTGIARFTRGGRIAAAVVSMVIAGLVVSCSPSAPGQREAERQAAARSRAQARAVELAGRLLILDSHIDYPDSRKASEDIVSGTSGNFDYPRATAGGLNAAFMAAYVPAEDEAAGVAFKRATERIDLVHADIARHPDKLALVRDPEEARTVSGRGALGLALGIENGAPLEGELGRLAHFRERGVSYITLTHAEDNHVCDSATDQAAAASGTHRWGGLSPFGREAVREMNRLGLMVDLAHVSDEAFWEALKLSTAPVIVSHGGLRRLTPGFERNLSDDMLKAVADKGGIVCLTFGSLFLKDRYRTTYARADIATVAEVAAAIDYAVKIAGVDHVGLGSDFDGVGFSLPRELADVSMYPNLIRELLLLGYEEPAIEKILGGNFLRVWDSILALAES